MWGKPSFHKQNADKKKCLKISSQPWFKNKLYPMVKIIDDLFPAVQMKTHTHEPPVRDQRSSFPGFNVGQAVGISGLKLITKKSLLRIAS